jgi:UDP-N-acetylglucosamine 1-carboxyvinyltransferase
MQNIFRVSGGKPLSGAVEISGSKNAALPILAATLAFRGETVITNLPDISDIVSFLSIIESLGGKVTRSGAETRIDASSLALPDLHLQHPAIKKMRASILLLAPLLVRFGEVKMPFPGGCVLGKRSAESHLRAFLALGAEVIESKEYLHLRVKPGGLTASTIVLPEISVTATENAVIAAAFTPGITEIRLAAAEPHVKNLCEFLQSGGIAIEGVGTHFLRITGNPEATTAGCGITPDYLEAGTFLLAGILTDSRITVKNVVPEQLDSFFEKLTEAGAEFAVDVQNRQVSTLPRKRELAATNIQTGVFPKFPTDLHPQFGVLLTQCRGTSKIFETLFERKFAYLLELEKMGADVELLNPHVFLIHGPKKLRGVPVASQDIRAGAAMLLAALIAEGETEISNIHYLDRGYQNIETKLRDLGADISREIR